MKEYIYIATTLPARYSNRAVTYNQKVVVTVLLKYLDLDAYNLGYTCRIHPWWDNHQSLHFAAVQGVFSLVNSGFLPARAIITRLCRSFNA